MRVGKDDFTVLTPTLWGVIRVVCDGKFDITAIQKPSLANTNGYKELVELRNEAQRIALEPEEKRARRAALAKAFGGNEQTKVQGFSRKGGRKGDTVTVKVNGTDVVMVAPLRADEPPRVKCDEDMLLSCLEYMKMRVGSVDDLLIKRSKRSAWSEGEAEGAQLNDDGEPAHPADELLATEAGRDQSPADTVHT
jgi:hypothetical protein